jgi:hypothetical protein
MLAGIVCWLAGASISTLMFIGLGAMGGSFTEWRKDLGLWMLGALFLLIFGSSYITCSFFQIADVVRGRAPLAAWPALDWLTGTSVLGLMVRFIWAVTY